MCPEFDANAHIVRHVVTYAWLLHNETPTAQEVLGRGLQALRRDLPIALSIKLLQFMFSHNYSDDELERLRAPENFPLLNQLVANINAARTGFDVAPIVFPADRTDTLP